MSRIGAVDPAALDGRSDVLDAIRAGRGWIPNIFATMLFSPELTAGWVGLANAVRTSSSLDDRSRELVILLVAHAHESEYEWDHHRGVARRLGVSDREIAWLAAWPAGDWGELDRATLTMAAATAERTVPPPWCVDDLMRLRGPRYVVDVAVAAAYYVAVSLFAAVLDIEAESSQAANRHSS